MIAFATRKKKTNHLTCKDTIIVIEVNSISEWKSIFPIKSTPFSNL